MAYKSLSSIKAAILAAKLKFQQDLFYFFNINSIPFVCDYLEYSLIREISSSTLER